MQSMTVTPALRELFAHKTQTAIAAELTLRGLKVDQTKVSAWMNGRQPSVEQIAAIEDWAGVPRGWVLARSGYMAMPGVEPVSPSGEVAALRQRVEKLEGELHRLAAHVATLGAATVRATRPDNRSGRQSP